MAEDARSFDISRVVSRAFELIGANLGMYLGLALLLVGVPNALFAFFTADNFAANADPTLFERPEFWAAFVAAMLVWLIANAVLQASLTRAAVSQLSGEPASFGDALGTGLRLFLPMIAITLLMWLAFVLLIALAMMPVILVTASAAAAVGPAVLLTFLLVFLAFIPMIALYIVWSVTVPAYVAERPGILGAFGRSRRLTKGARFRIFVVLLAVVIGTSVLSYAANMLALAAAAAAPMLAVPVAGAVGALNAMVMVTILASVYVELRDVKEGVAPDALEAIFA